MHWTTTSELPDLDIMMSEIEINAEPDANEQEDGDRDSCQMTPTFAHALYGGVRGDSASADRVGIRTPKELFLWQLVVFDSNLNEGG